MNTQHQLVLLVLSVKDAELAELKSRTALITTQIENSKSLIQEREMNKKLRSDNASLQCTISELQAGVEERANTTEMNATSTKRKDSKLQAKNRALERCYHLRRE